MLIERILVNFGVPFFICAVMPVLIVWIVVRARQNEANKRAEILLKAIEAGVPVDADALMPKKKSNSSIKQDLLGKLTGGCITSFIGLAFLTLGIIRAVNGEFGNGMMLNPLWLPAGGVLLAVGIGLLISFFTGRKMLAKEMDAEEKRMAEQQ